MREILLASLFLLLAPSFAAYTPYYGPDPLTSINTTNWTQNGVLTATSTGLTSSDATGGSLITKITSPVSPTYDFEVDATLTLTASGGTFDFYLEAGATSLSGPTSSNGTFYVFELTPTFSGTACSAQLNAYWSQAGTVHALGTTTTTCHNGWRCAPCTRLTIR